MILGQLMQVVNPDPQINLDNNEFKDHEAYLFMPVYNKGTGLYAGLTKNWHMLH